MKRTTSILAIRGLKWPFRIILTIILRLKKIHYRNGWEMHYSITLHKKHFWSHE